MTSETAPVIPIPGLLNLQVGQIVYVCDIGRMCRILSLTADFASGCPVASVESVADGLRRRIQVVSVTDPLLDGVPLSIHGPAVCEEGAA